MPGLSSIDGLNSGLKTTDIVNNIMLLERRSAVYLEAEQAEKTNAISALSAFQARLLAFRSEVAALARSTTWSLSSISVSDEKKLSAVVSSGSVGSGSYQVQVRALARNHQLASQGYTDKTSLNMGTGVIKIGVGAAAAKDITIDTTNNSLNGIKDAINAAKVGVTASIVFDGSKSNSYRLVLSSDTAGIDSKIEVSSTLTGTNNFNFSTASFDQPETVSKAATSDSKISLGSTAAFGGTTNKTYSFTVSGNGEQTIGTDTITVNWTDGTNSGAIVVSAADSEVALAGVGADGLKLSFGSGKLNAGDTFQVQTFAPLLQEAANAQIAIGNTGGNGSPITISSATNTFTDVLGGLSITIKALTDPGENITISAEPNVAGMRDRVTNFVKAYNEMVKFVDDQNEYKPGATETGVLFGDPIVQSIAQAIRNTTGSKVGALDGKYSQLFGIGIRSDSGGRLTIRDSARLEEALRTNPEAVRRLFVESGESSSNKIEYISSGAKAKAGTPMGVDVIEAATKGTYRGLTIPKLSVTSPLRLDATNNHFRITVNGADSLDIKLTERSYTSVEDFVAEVQSKLDSDTAVKAFTPKFRWVDTTGNNGYFELENGTYGSSSTISIREGTASTPFNTIGLIGGTATAGKDVKGTINGEPATGSGQILTGDEKNRTTSGVKVRVKFEESEFQELAEGNVTVTRGVAASLLSVIDQITSSGDGRLDRRIKSVQDQVANIKARVVDIDKRLALRREALFKRFFALEDRLGSLNANGQFLSNQLAGLQTNFG